MERLKQLQEKLAKQAVIDNQRLLGFLLAGADQNALVVLFFRIQYRREELERKRVKMADERREREEEREKLYNRLEQLRNQVRVEAERDLERTLKATVASDAKCAHSQAPETSYQPANTDLFIVNTFKGKRSAAHCCFHSCGKDGITVDPCFLSNQ